MMQVQADETRFDAQAEASAVRQSIQPDVTQLTLEPSVDEVRGQNSASLSRRWMMNHHKHRGMNKERIGIITPRSPQCAGHQAQHKAGDVIHWVPGAWGRPSLEASSRMRVFIPSTDLECASFIAAAILASSSCRENA